MRVDIRGEATKIFVRRLIVRLLEGWSFSLPFFSCTPLLGNYRAKEQIPVIIYGPIRPRLVG